MGIEHDLLAKFPPRLAGPFGVVLCTFFIITLLFTALAKLRPDSMRMKAKLRQDRAAALKTGGNPPSIRSAKSELSMRTIAWLHAALVGYAGMKMLLLNPEFNQDGFMRLPEHLSLAWTDPAAEFYLSIGVAYFLGDLIVLLTQYEEYGPLFLFHAVCGLLGLGWSVITNQGHAYCLVAFCYELSTPFVNNIFFLKTYFPTYKLANIANGLCLLVVFIANRIVLGLPASWKMWNEMAALHAAGSLSSLSFVLMTVIVGGLSSLNILWSFKLLKGFAALATGGKVKEPSNPYKKN